MATGEVSCCEVQGPCPDDLKKEVVPPRVAHEHVRSGMAVLVDVRTPAEFREVHTTLAVNCPLDSLSPQEIVASHAADGKTIALICRSGGRSSMALRKFRDAGIEHAISVEGGMQNWESQGLDVVRGKAAMALDRQVRIAAGLLVVLGCIAGWLGHPLGFAVSAGVGAGLVFAGVTNTCPMSSTLARMPWNR